FFLCDMSGKQLSLFLLSFSHLLFLTVFFLNDTASTEFYTLSLHDALPISAAPVKLKTAMALARSPGSVNSVTRMPRPTADVIALDRKSTRLNSSHVKISYAVFCLKKKTNIRK